MIIHKKTSILFFLLLWIFLGYTQTIELSYQPKSAVIECKIGQTKFYTDTLSVFSIYEDKDSKIAESYYTEVRNIIHSQLSASISDTLRFEGDPLRIEDSSISWNINWVLIRLIEKNRVEIFDKEGTMVKEIVVKRKNLKHMKQKQRVYMNKKTKQVVFREKVYRSMGNPKF